VRVIIPLYLGVLIWGLVAGVLLGTDLSFQTITWVATVVGVLTAVLIWGSIDD